MENLFNEKTLEEAETERDKDSAKSQELQAASNGDQVAMAKNT